MCLYVEMQLKTYERDVNILSPGEARLLETHSLQLEDAINLETRIAHISQNRNEYSAVSAHLEDAQN